MNIINVWILLELLTYDCFLYFSIFLVCVMVEDNTNGFFITHYNIYGIYIYIYICSELSQLVRLIAEHLHSEDLQTILVIPAMMRGWVVELLECVQNVHTLLISLLHSMSLPGDMNYRVTSFIIVMKSCKLIEHVVLVSLFLALLCINGA